MEIKTMRWGLAYRNQDIIWVNDDLLKYPNLYNKVIDHELKHQPGAYNLKDLKHDIRIPSLQKMIFVLTHPRTWTIISPVWIENGKLVYDPGYISLFLLGIILGISFKYLK